MVVEEAAPSDSSLTIDTVVLILTQPEDMLFSSLLSLAVGELEEYALFYLLMLISVAVFT